MDWTTNPDQYGPGRQPDPKTQKKKELVVWNECNVAAQQRHHLPGVHCSGASAARGRPRQRYAHTVAVKAGGGRSAGGSGPRPQTPRRRPPHERQPGPAGSFIPLRPQNNVPGAGRRSSRGMTRSIEAAAPPGAPIPSAAGRPTSP